MTFDELTARVHAVMDRYKIHHRHDLAFLAEIAWVLGIEVDFKVTPKVPDVTEQDAAHDRAA